MPERDQTSAGPRRVIDALCTHHQAETLTNGWPFGGSGIGCFRTAAAHCDACATAINTLTDNNGNLWLHTLTDLTTTDVDRHAAVHEAAHAVVGIHTGHTLLHLSIATDGNGWPADSEYSGLAGQVSWEFEVPVADHLTAVWAGEAAGLHWLTQHGHDTTANRLDIAYLAATDVAEADRWATQFAIPITTGRAEAAHLVAEHWPAITTLADQLVTRREMCGADVHDMHLVSQPHPVADNGADDTDGDG